MLLADIAETRWRQLMRGLARTAADERGETAAVLAQRADMDRPRWSHILLGDRIPVDRSVRRILLNRVFEALQAPADVRLELGVLAGTVEWLPSAPVSVDRGSRVRVTGGEYAPETGTVIAVRRGDGPPGALVALDGILEDSDLDPGHDGIPPVLCHWLPLAHLEVAP